MPLPSIALILSLSCSRRSDFEKCWYLAKLKYLDEIPAPEHPLPPGKDR